MGRSRLVAAFVEGRGQAPATAVSDPELEDRIGEALARAEQTWPGLAVEAEAVARFLGRASAASTALTEPGPAWRELALQDLALAAACLAGDATAMRIFERELSSVLGTRERDGPPTPGEVEQTIRTKLFVAAEGLPKIAEYAGRGRLRSWLRVVVSRTRIDLARKRKDHISPSEAAWARIESAADTPELDLIRQTYRREFTAAFSHAVAQLTPRERNCLRQRLFHGLKNAEIAEAHQVDVRTIKRWMAAARERLLTQTRKWLTDNLDVSGQELDSLVRLFDGGVELSVGRMLLSDDPDRVARP